jgi:hypothetical protein
MRLSSKALAEYSDGFIEIDRMSAERFRSRIATGQSVKHQLFKRRHVAAAGHMAPGWRLCKLHVDGFNRSRYFFPDLLGSFSRTKSQR